jgi:divalent metal cation (Fe/Co/Zn/Cd) transporter
MAVGEPVRETARRLAVLLRRGRILEGITLGWNVAGIAVLAVRAVAARSVALAGFGLDSLIEIGAFVALAVYLTIQAVLVLVTEGRVTLVDGILAVAVLAGLVLNAAAGWWQADPLAALVIVAYALREAREIFQGCQ